MARPSVLPVQLLRSASSDALADRWLGKRSKWAPAQRGSGARRRGGGQVHIRLERDGTQVWLRGIHDRAAAIEAAAGLVPVSVG